MDETRDWLIVHSFYIQDKNTPFVTVGAALRIGTKYEFSMLRQEALRRIVICFPAELGAFQAHMSAEVACDTSRCPFTWDRTTSLAVCYFASRFNLFELLPAALYRCATQNTLSELFSIVSTPATKGEHPYPLSIEDFRKCLEAREYLVSRTRSIQQIISNCWPWPSGCQHQNRCVAAVKNMIFCLHERSVITDCDALRPLEGWIFGFRETKKQATLNPPPDLLCRTCVAHKMSSINEHQRETWEYIRTNLCSLTVSHSEPAMSIVCLNPAIRFKVTDTKCLSPMSGLGEHLHWRQTDRLIYKDSGVD